MSETSVEPDVQDRFLREIERVLPPAPWLVAVSGGSDSTALLILSQKTAAALDIAPPIAVTVDHGLRPEAAEECERVRQWAEVLGLTHRTIKLSGLSASREVQAAARTARYEALGELAFELESDSVLLGHTQNDQAETFLMRMAKKSGLDGLACMSDIAPLPLIDPKFDRLKMYRPLLSFSRQELRTYLTERGHDWIDDPSNDDLTFGRVRIRAFLDGLEASDFKIDAIAETARHLGEARTALDELTAHFLTETAEISQAGYAVVDQAAFHSVPREIALRALQKLLMLVGGRLYGAGRDQLDRLLATILDSGSADTKVLATLGECEIAQMAGGRRVLISREYKRSGKEEYSGRAECPIGVGGRTFWDNRFEISLSGLEPAVDVPSSTGFSINFLGNESRQIQQLVADENVAPSAAESWAALPARVRPSLPALFRGNDLALLPVIRGVSLPLTENEQFPGLRLSAWFKSNRFG